MGVAAVDPVGFWLEGNRNGSCSKPDTKYIPWKNFWQLGNVNQNKNVFKL